MAAARGGSSQGSSRVLELGTEEDWPDLTRDQITASCHDGICPFCGRDGLRALATHFRLRHGVNAEAVRVHYGFMRKQSFCTPELAARYAELTRRAMRDPERAAAARDAERKYGGYKHRPQAVEKLRARDASSMRGCRRWSREQPEELLAALRKAQENGQKRLRVLWKDEEWLDAKKRRFKLATRREVVRRWEAGESAGELARAYDANPHSIIDILAEQGAAGVSGRRLRYHHYLLTAEQEEEVVRRLLAGEPRKVLAAEYGCSPGHISHLAKAERPLTARELEILSLLATDATLKDIASQLGITQKTVSCVRSIIYRKLKVRNRAAAIRRAAELGLIAHRA